MLAIAASHDWNVIQLDVQTTFLQSETKEEVYLKESVGFEKLDLNGLTICLQAKDMPVRTQTITPQLARNYPS